jgi:antitoxin component YwqK of YwqJK toxin-antitoxin module
MRYLFLVIGTTLVSLSHIAAQNVITLYYDKDWKQTFDISEAAYFRKASQTDNNQWAVRDFYISGKLQMTGTYKTRKFETKVGRFIYYYMNGQKSSEGEYLNDKHEGLWTYWYENGNKSMEGKYKNDMKYDIWTYWYESGKKKSEGPIKNGHLNGYWVRWYENGSKQAEGLQVDGVNDGVWTFYYESELLKQKEYYKSGYAVWTEGYYENGKLELKGQYLSGKSTGEWSYWNVDGILYLKGKYANDLRVGEWVRYLPNGEKIKLNYVKGELVGKKYGGIYKNK